jgi:urease accessory protein
LLAVESIVFGRQAMGEDLRAGMLHDSWRIRCAGRLVWADTLRLEGDIAGLRRAPFGFGTAVAFATLVFAAHDAGELLEPVRAVLEDAAEETGVTLLDGLLIIRLLDTDALRLRSRVVRLAGLIRHKAAGISRALPRVWHC